MQADHNVTCVLMQKVTEQRVQNAVLRKHLDAKVAANTAASQFIDQLTQVRSLPCKLESCYAICMPT